MIFQNLPGAAKAINEGREGELPFLCTDVACNLHHVKKIVIVNHSDCGAYGGKEEFVDAEEEQEFHEFELKKARRILNKRYPKKELILVYAKRNNKREEIDFIEVK